ncbi:MAG: YbhB/YbcL family Raf kinase inhibitor-like protein [Candidatus Omnitrophica bacterium]|nr:YbhB/YbcL family Raf kinase inhibitor-like protein [Candidatus Omnitrophota bacterium]
MMRVVGFLVITGIMLSALAAEAQMEEKEAGEMKLTSPEFEHKGVIPSKFTCQGNDVNPALIIEGLPNGVKSLVLIVDDPDAPMGTWVHWVVYDIPVIPKIEENSIPGMQGGNDFGRKDYGGPCPPSGTHRYFFKLYALDTQLNLPEGIGKEDLEKAMQGHILDQTELIGLYKKH